jgi:hypothetical protein
MAALVTIQSNAPRKRYVRTINGLGRIVSRMRAGGAGVPSNALVQLQAQHNHCGEAASEKCLSAATFVS